MRLYWTILICSFCCTQYVQAQGLYYSFFFAPTYVHQQTDYPYTETIHGGRTYVQSQDDQPRRGFCLGAEVAKPLTDRFLLKSGLYFSRYSFYSLIERIDPETDFYMLGRTGGDFDFYYLGLPIGAKFYLLDAGVQLYVSASLQIQYLLYDKIDGSFLADEWSTNSYKHSNNTFRDNYKPINRINYTTGLGIGLEVPAFGKSLYIQPTFSYFLKPFGKKPWKRAYRGFPVLRQTLQYRQLYSLGLLIGITL